MRKVPAAIRRWHFSRCMRREEERPYGPVPTPSQRQPCSVRYMGSGQINIDVFEQIVHHKIVITLIIVMIQSLVFVKIHCGHLRKIQIAFIVPFYQLFVGSHRSGTCSKSQNAIRFGDDLSGNNICSFSAHVIIIFGYDKSHVKTLLLSLI